MPKDRRKNLFSDRDRGSPYASISKDSNHSQTKNHFSAVRDEKEWKEARCPICMEYPHNAVLLLCRSCAKGCRPYICDTSYRHSNCLDQFINLYDGTVSRKEECFYMEQIHAFWINVALTYLRPTKSTQGLVPQVLCPFCRGQVIGWVVVENVRAHMNSKVRNCSLDSCNFSGNYIELRKHARAEHPNVKPSDTDPERQADWARLTNDMDLRDTLNVVQYHFENEELYNYSPYDSGGDTPTAPVGNGSRVPVTPVVASDVRPDFTSSLLNDIFGPDGSLTCTRWPCMELIKSRSQRYDGGRRRQNTTVQSRSGSCSEGVKEITDDRLLERRSSGCSRSRFQSQSPPRMARETGSRYRSFDLRPNSESEVTSGRRRVRNSRSSRTGVRSSAERTLSHERWRNPHHHVV